MNKTEVITILKDCFKIEGNCVFLHFIDGSELLVQSEPTFFSSNMSVDIEYNNEKSFVEKCYIPYNSILYITVTTIENVKFMVNKYSN